LIVHFGDTCGSRFENPCYKYEFDLDHFYSHDNSIDVFYAVEPLQDKDYSALVSNMCQIEDQLSPFSAIRLSLAPAYAMHLGTSNLYLLCLTL